MPNIKSAAKRARQALRFRATNRAVTSLILKANKRFLQAVTAGDKSKAQEAFAAYCSVLDKAAKHGVIKPNNADRKKARASSKLAKIKTA